jgi:hypothetical protein
LLLSLILYPLCTCLDDPYPTSLKQLYARLIAPLMDKLYLPVLGIVPYGVLHYLPFAALTDGRLCTVYPAEWQRALF